MFNLLPCRTSRSSSVKLFPHHLVLSLCCYMTLLHPRCRFWHLFNSMKCLPVRLSGLVQFSLGMDPALQCTDQWSQFVFVHKLAEDVLYLIIQDVNEDIKQLCSQYWSLRDATSYWLPTGLCATGIDLSSSAVQTIFWSPIIHLIRWYVTKLVIMRMGNCQKS